MDYGVLPTGFIKMRLPEIRAAIIADLKQRLLAAGLPADIQTRPDSVLGLLIDTFAEREAALWNVAEGVYNAMYPDTAAGIALDNAVAFTGVRRLGARPSAADLLIYADRTIQVPRGAQFKNTVTQTVWATTADLTVSAANAAELLIVPTAQPDFTYWVALGDSRFAYRSGHTATADEVADGLKTALSASSDFAVEKEGVFLRIRSLASDSIRSAVSDHLAIAEIGAVVPASPLEGLEEAAADTITEAVTLIDGMKRVRNRVAVAGRVAESDEDLRARYETGVYALGAATHATILANLKRDIPTARDIHVFENDTDVQVGDLKPHSIKVLIDGGKDDEIAQAIYRVKAAGINTNGDMAKTITTPTGNQVIRFSRPTYRYIWVQATLTLLTGTDAAFPADGYESVRADLNSIGQKLQVGDDVVVQKFYCGVFKTPGVESVTFKFAASNSPTVRPADGAFSPNNIVIGNYERAMFDPMRIEVR